MSSKVTFMNIISTCRICMNVKNKFLDIFTSTETIGSISSAIMECAPINISQSDCLPHVICENCLDKLKNAYDFRILCINTDTALREKAKAESVSSDDDDNGSQYPKSEMDGFNDNSFVPLKNESDIKSENEEILNYLQIDINPEVSNVDNKDGVDIKIENTNEKSSKKKSPSKLKRKKCGPKKKPLLPAEDGFYHCDLCVRKYKYKHDLERHSISHTNIRYYCDDCGKEFKAMKNLRYHQAVHRRERKYNCEFCGAMFHLTRNLLSHRQIHLNIRKFSCTYCEKNFRLKRALENHMRIHTGERPFVCDVCGKSFNRKHHLSTHRQIHGEKRYKCTMCPQTFITKQNLNIHTMTKHYS